MRLHLRRMEMILAGTAVIYNLTRSEQSNQLPLDLLNRAVRMTLTAMEKFPDNRQLQKNCFLTLCSDTVLYRATFNCIQCCELVFNNLLSFDDIHMKRMGVAIISILAAEISTSGLSDLAKDPRRIECLLSYVADKCLLVADVPDLGSALRSYMPQLRFRTEGAPIFDTTLRFTLSALWNLTDECPEACLRFVHQGGLIIYEKVLKRFADQNEETKNHVYTKCLGLLNNVAEVEQTRESLLKESLMNFFFKMLRHPCIQISYFAAGIIAHLSCLKDDIWLRNIQSSRESYIKLLGQAVCNWQPPHSEMVAYRSFEPFGLLVLHPESRLEIHLWAVWAIHHILTRKEMRYVPVLCECQPLLSFLRLVVSLDETALCAHSLQRQISNQDSHNVKSHFHDDNADDNVGNNDMESGDLIKSPVSCDIIHAQTSSVYSPSDHFSEVSVCDCFISENQQAQSSRHLSATIGHAEPASKILNSVHSRHMKNVQKFAYFMVLDFEATCEKDIKIPDPEIIEFPVLMVNAYTLHTESIFHHYVRPTINPVLSDFCTELTGIIQSMIEDEPELPSILKMFDLFLDKNNLKICPYKFAFVTCGDWDLKIMYFSITNVFYSALCYDSIQIWL
ncbi:Protein zyg-11 isoform 1 [Schistosoma japonicum]|nr:Protein zyg-11 isoform 1 [Schistosoma japonicum]